MLTDPLAVHPSIHETDIRPFVAARARVEYQYSYSYSPVFSSLAAFD